MADRNRQRLADLSRDDASPVAAAAALQAIDAPAMVEAALAAGRVRLAYQPVVQGAAPDRVAFHEGLIRVLDDTGRAIPAREFITAVETAELGRRLDCAALEAGLRALQQRPWLRLAVNMSARSIGYPRWMRILRRGLAAGPTVGERLILELGEDSVVQAADVVGAFMAELQPHGVAFALDDFGAGRSSFRLLRDLDFDIAKIDGQFVRGLHRNPDNRLLVRALVGVGHQFDMLTVAESVETRADAQVLQAMQVGAMQGYLFGAPTVRPSWDEDAARKTA